MSDTARNNIKSKSASILLFSKYPVPGKAKTRLIPEIGQERAALLHRRMTEHAVSAMRSAQDMPGPCDLELSVCCTGAPLKEFSKWLGPDLNYVSQPEGDLGCRLLEGFVTAFRNGSERTIAVGCDIPGLTPEILLKGIDALTEHDIVIGPAEDGGYYLIGMRTPRPELFADILWGTEHVYRQTMEAAKKLGLTAAELPMLSDIDLPADLSAIRDDPRFREIFNDRQLISIIIPTLNESGILEQTLNRLRSSQEIEIIVADGGSQDNTAEVAARSGALVLSVSGGRAAQMNAGAAESKGHILLFLHADTILPALYHDVICEALKNPSVSAGAFRFKTDGPGAAIRVVEWFTNIRSSVFHFPYGDQGLFMEKRVFEEIGGFPDLPIMEDFELVRRLRRRGDIVIIPEPAVTSARRWRKLGVLKTTLINQFMILGFLAGIKPARLKQIYRSTKDNKFHSRRGE